MKKTLLTALFASLAFGAMAQKQVTISVTKDNGEWTIANAAKTWAQQWTSTSTDPQLTLTSDHNNMAAYGGTSNIQLFTNSTAQGNGNSSVYTLAATEGWKIVNYSIDFVSNANGTDVSITPYPSGDAVTTSSSTEKVTFTGSSDNNKAMFIVSTTATSNFANTSNFTVTLEEYEPGEEPEVPGADEVQYLFVNHSSNAHPYRIPAIAKCSNGDLLALTDWRICGGDIGQGEVDIHYRISEDNGATWGDEIVLLDGTGNYNDWNYGYGDAAIVADSESDEVLVITAAGNTFYSQCTRQNPLRMSRTYSHDNGRTWDASEEITEDIYGIFDKSKMGALKAAFFGSGRICQSRQIKVDKYYRLYAALCARDGGNRVIYSDDFGRTWASLGTIDASPAPNGDEPKVEELPNGSVVLSSRMNGGRYYNIFTYSDQRNAAGEWGTVANSANIATGVKATSNSTNGEILVIPATKKTDGSQAFVALQSVPLGPGRANVGIYYKALTDADYTNPTTFATGWGGPLHVSDKNSCYSTMCVQADGRIAFYYEEETFADNKGGGYTEVYHPFTLEQLTENKYAIDLDYNPFSLVIEAAKTRVEEIYTDTPLPYRMLGMALPDTEEGVKAALEAYIADPANMNALEAFDKACDDAVLQVQDGEKYVLINVATGTALVKNGTENNYVGLEGDNYTDDVVWTTLYKDTKKGYSLYNEATATYLRGASILGNTIQSATSQTTGGFYNFNLLPGCKVNIRSVVATAAAPFINLKSTLVGSNDAADEKSQWYVVIAEDIVKGQPDGIESANTSATSTTELYDLQGRKLSAGSAVSTSAAQHGIYIKDGRKIVF